MAEETGSLDNILSQLNEMSAADLTRLIEAAEAQRREAAERGKRELIEKIRAEAEALGLPMRDLFASLSPAAVSTSKPARRPRKAPAAEGDGATSGPGSKVPVQFRGPNGEEWSGRGRLPRWLTALEAEGRSRDEFRV